ncbi:MAG: hypothetical protein U1E96_04895 [Azonexus sp.]
MKKYLERAIECHPAAVKQLAKIDKPVRNRMLEFPSSAAVGNPRASGGAKTGDHAGSQIYRIGDYRVIAELVDDPELSTFIWSCTAAKSIDKRPVTISQLPRPRLRGEVIRVIRDAPSGLLFPSNSTPCPTGCF